MAIFTKHFELSKLGHDIQHWDIGLIASVAKQNMVQQKLPLFISSKLVPQDCLVPLAVLEATLNYLNRHHLLSKTLTVKYTDSKL